MSEAKLREYIKKRSSLKGKLTIFSSYLDVQKTCSQLSDLQLAELQLRLEKIENLYGEFDNLQTGIESLTDDQEAFKRQMDERMVTETEYYSLVAASRVLLDEHRGRLRPQSPFGSAASSGSAESNVRSHNFVRLPKIDLPHFDGGYQNWLEFRDTYLSLIHDNQSINQINKFHYLRAALKGSAAIVIQSLDFRSDNYVIAWQLLTERYDNQKLLINNHVSALFNVEPIQRESSKSLHNLIDITNRNLRALATLRQPTDHWDTLIIYMMSSKLDSVTNREWEERRNSLDDFPTLSVFIKFLSNRADFLESLEEAKHNKGSKPEFKNKSFVVFNNKPKKIPCPECKKDHSLFQCFVFRSLSVESRLQRAKQFKVCLNCLSIGHTESQCHFGHCKYCKTKHHTLLHNHNEELNDEKPNGHENEENVALSARNSKSITNSNHVLLSTAVVKVVDGAGKLQTARVLLDNGSTANFVTQELCGKLNLHTSVVNSRVTGINSQVSSSSKSCSITIESCHGGFRTDIDCYVLPNITSSIPTSYIKTNNIQIPTGISLADPSFNVPSAIQILVGAEIFWKVIGINRIQLGKNKPTLFETKFGWLVSGGLHQSNPDSPLCMFTRESRDTSAEPDISRFWELDTVLPKHKMTPEERACEESFATHTKRDFEGRFIVTLPLKDSPQELGESFIMAKRRFIALERRLEREPKMKQLYVEFLNEYVTLGHMSESPHNSTSHVTSCFLPHHGVLRESSSTTKLRVVFDASSITSSGKSFNSIQRVGPTIQDDLMSILLRFRQHNFVVSADIEKMYRQINVVESQRPLQQILWRSDPSQKLRSYTLNTVTYGTASAPYLATRCITQLGQDSTNKNVKRALCHDFYVDDYLSGADSLQETIALCRGVVETLESAKFYLRKWHSNNKDILQAVCKNDDMSGTVDLSINELSKTLGLHWKCSDDTLTFSINVATQKTVNKRNILSTIAQVFDPLGLVSPCIVEAKMIMQLLWIQKCTWDEEVPQHIKRAWLEFSKSLPHLNNLTIPRCIKTNSPSNITLHTFSDASERAYGACVYVHSVSKDGTVDVRLLASKSKVAPTKPPTTIPRLELSAALLGTRLCAKVTSSLTLEFNECVFWADSTIVLGWLSSSPTNLKTFVRHRVCEIQEATSSNQWHYVPSKENPADLVSRGISADQLGATPLWWSGPHFLKLDQSKWPTNPNKDSNVVLPEIVKSFHINTSENTLFKDLTLKFSSFSKLINVVAFLLRFISNCRNATKSQGSLSPGELNNATNVLVRAAQRESFPEEHQLLLSSKDLPPKNKLLSLSPFMDEDNIIRVGGRLSNSHYDYNVKHPILLCGKHRLCELIFQLFHITHFHSGPQLLLATVRHKYWPLGGRNLAKRTVHSCIKCCRFKGATVQPIMGNLPEQRVELEFPFLEAGVDYAGPVMISNRKGRGSQLVKSYMCVFVCLATKAVHLELVSDLTKEAYIAAINRFVARRGKPRSIFSDNGTTFQGTFHELSRLLNKSLQSSVTEQGINFSFIPAYTPHFGGLWESAIKSIKHHLRRVLDSTHLTYEEMSTLLIQVEAILNSRPITPISDDPSDLYPLTPAHFLIGRSLTCVPHPQITNTRVASLQRFQRIELLKQQFWNRFSNEYIVWLQQKTKWRQSQGELKEGTLVVVKDRTLPPLLWLLGRITRVLAGRDGIARVADIRTKKGVIRRAFNNICPLPLKSIEDYESSTPAACSSG